MPGTTWRGKGGPRYTRRMQWRRVLVLAGVAIAVATLCVRLGLWQLDRRAQRRALNAERDTTLALPVLTIDSAADTVSRWRRVRATGVYDHDHQVVLVNRPRNGVPGVLVATPLRLTNGEAVYVVRGWVPTPDAATVDLHALTEPQTVTIVGYVERAEEPTRDVPAEWPLRLLRLDPTVLASKLPYAVRSYTLRQLPQAGVPDLPQRLPPPASDEGPHLSYAVQWFSFAAIALIGIGVLAWREIRAT